MSNDTGQTDRNWSPCLLKKSLLLSSCESNSGSPCKSLLMFRPEDVLNFFTASSPDCFCSTDIKKSAQLRVSRHTQKSFICAVKQIDSEPAQHITPAPSGEHVPAALFWPQYLQLTGRPLEGHHHQKCLLLLLFPIAAPAAMVLWGCQACNSNAKHRDQMDVTVRLTPCACAACIDWSFKQVQLHQHKHLLATTNSSCSESTE